MEPEEINPLDNLERADFGGLALPAAADEDEEERQEKSKSISERKQKVLDTKHLIYLLLLSPKVSTMF